MRSTDGPGEPNGAFVKATVELVGEAAPESPPLVPGSNRTAEVDLRLGDMDLLPPSKPVVEKLALSEVEGCSFSGSGNKGPLFFFRRPSLKNVVVEVMT